MSARIRRIGIRFYSNRHAFHLLGEVDLAGHAGGLLIVVVGRQQHIDFLFGGGRCSFLVREQVDSAGGAGQLLIAESEDVGVGVDHAIGDVHEVIA